MKTKTSREKYKNPEGAEDLSAENDEGVWDVTKLFDSREEALMVVKEFWQQNMYKHHFEHRNDLDYYEQQITLGDRTYCFKEGSKWRVIFNGNGYPISNGGLRWLKEHGLAQEKTEKKS
jgi:hypothetical protein